MGAKEITQVAVLYEKVNSKGTCNCGFLNAVLYSPPSSTIIVLVLYKHKALVKKKIFSMG